MVISKSFLNLKYHKTVNPAPNSQIYQAETLNPRFKCNTAHTTLLIKINGKFKWYMYLVPGTHFIKS